MLLKDKTDTSIAEFPGVAAVSRALSILRAFGNDDLRLSLSEIAQRTGLYKSTVLRLTESLVALEFLIRDSDGEYRLGFEFLRLGALARRSIGGANDIIATLEELMRETGESATYYVRRGASRLALYRVDSPKSVRDNIRAGDLLPLEFGAAGRILQMSSENDAVEKGPNTFKLAVSLGERDSELAAIAGPVYSGAHIVAALSVSGPISRFSPAVIQEISTLVENKCRHLSTIV